MKREGADTIFQMDVETAPLAQWWRSKSAVFHSTTGSCSTTDELLPGNFTAESQTPHFGKCGVCSEPNFSKTRVNKYDCVDTPLKREGVDSIFQMDVETAPLAQWWRSKSAVFHSTTGSCSTTDELLPGKFAAESQTPHFGKCGVWSETEKD